MFQTYPMWMSFLPGVALLVLLVGASALYHITHHNH